MRIFKTELFRNFAIGFAAAAGITAPMMSGEA